MEIVAAGAQNPAFLKTLEKAGYPYILMSFFQIRKNVEAGRKKLAHAKSAGMKVLLDSGAHSFYNQYSHLDVRKKDARAQADRRFVKEKQTSREDLIAECDAYTREYIAFLSENRDIVPSYAELDIDSLVGIDRVREWRRWFAEAGLQPICTYHGSDEFLKAGGTPAFIREIVELGFPYIGIAREADKNAARLFFTKNLAELKKHRIRVHLWGMTEQRTWLDLAGASVDSTSWLNGSKYGTTHVWVPGTMKMHLHDYKVKAKVRPKLKGYCEENGIDFKKFLDEDDDEVNLYHACQWRDFARHLDRYTPNAYWLSHEEKVAIAMPSKKKVDVVETPVATPEVEIVAGGPKQTALAELIPSVGKDGRVARYEDPRTDIKLRCIDCYIKDKCPKFQPEEGATCVFPFSVKINSVDDLKAGMTALVEGMLARTMHAVMVERVQGGVLDPNVSKELKANVELIQQLKELFEAPRARLTITAEGGAADGASQKGGLLASLFGNLGNEK